MNHDDKPQNVIGQGPDELDRMLWRADGRGYVLSAMKHSRAFSIYIQEEAPRWVKDITLIGADTRDEALLLLRAFAEVCPEDLRMVVDNKVRALRAGQ